MYPTQLSKTTKQLAIKLINFFVIIFAIVSCIQSTLGNTAARLNKPSPQTVAFPAPIQSLVPFFKKLSALESGKRSTPLVIVHLGDSHTAGDRFSGRLRELFQHRFGASGRGMLPPGKIYKYYKPSMVTIEQSPKWQLINSFAKTATGVFGISGYRLSSKDPTALFAVTSTDPAGFDNIAVEFVYQPQGGTLVASVDGMKAFQVSTKHKTRKVGNIHKNVQSMSKQIELHPLGDGPIALLSLTLQRNNPGILYHSHGILGVTMDIINKWDKDTITGEMKTLNPALLVLAYGTNEGFDDALQPQHYKSTFAAHLAFLSGIIPNTAIAIVGSPDANRLPHNCHRQKQATKRCWPLSQADIENYAIRFGKNASGASCQWHPPPNLVKVRNIQRQIAHDNGFFFWDWSAAVMGGDCGIHNWRMREPDQVNSDHVHLRTKGYHISAEILFKELMKHYDMYKQTLSNQISTTSVEAK